MLRWLAVLVALLIANGVLAQDHTVRGTVRDAATGVALPRARVAATSGGTVVYAVTRTDERGEFTLTLPPKATAIQVSRARYGTAILTSLGGDLPDVRLRPAAALTGRLLDLAGAPLIGRQIRASLVSADGRIPAETAFWTMTDDRGEFRLGALPEGRYVVGYPERSIQTEPITVRAGETIDVPEIRATATPCRQSPLVFPQQPNVRALRVRVRVLSSGGIPLACATVRLLGGPGLFNTITDGAGRGELQSIPADSFTVDARLPGFTANTRAVTAPPPDSAQAARGLDIELRLSPAPAISGTLFGTDGEPLLDAEVQAERVQRVGTRLVRAGVTLPATTDDLGHFRLQNVTPGTYAISATSGPRELDALLSPGSIVPVFFPGVIDLADATLIDVPAAGRDGIDFTLPEISGVPVDLSVAMPNGDAIEYGIATLATAERSGPSSRPKLRQSITDGHARFPGVPPGDYVLQVAHTTGFEFGAGRVYVTIDNRPPAPVSMRLSPGHELRGHIVVEDGADVPPAANVELIAAGGDDVDLGSENMGATREEAWFANNVVGARRFVLKYPAALAMGWYLKSARVGGRETIDQVFDFGFGTERLDDIELVLSPRGATVTGSLRDRAQPYTAVIFSTAPEDWYVRSPRVQVVGAERDGRFSASSLPPGTYYVAAVPPLDAALRGNWDSAVSLDDLTAGATRVTLDEGQTQDVRLTLAR